MGEEQLQAPLGVDRVALVEHEQARAVAGADGLERLVDGAHHLGHVLLGRRGVDDVQDEVGLARLVQRRGEGVDDLMGQLADEADGVRQQVRAAVDAQLAGRRVQRVEEAVADADLGAGQAVEQRRLAGVRVAGEGDLRQVRALALGAHRRARRGDADRACGAAR